MRKLIIILFVLVSQIIFAQTQKLSKDDKKVAADKMLARVKKTKADTIYVDSLISVGKQFIEIDIDLAELWLNEASFLLEKSNRSSDFRFIEAQHQLGIILLNRGKFRESIKQNEYVLQLRFSKYGKETFDHVRSQINISIALRELNEIEAYENLMNDITSELKQAGYYDHRFNNHFSNYFNYLIEFNRINEAFGILTSLYEIQKRNNDFEGMATTHLKFGRTLNNLGDTKNAIDEILSSIKIYDEKGVNNIKLKIEQLEQISTCLININQFDKAKTYLLQLESISKDDLFSFSASRCALALIARIQGDLKISEKYILSIEKEYDKNQMDNSLELAEHYIYLGRLFSMYQFDHEALQLTSKAYSIYKINAPEGQSRFPAISMIYATSLQNVGRFADAIVIYEDLLNSASESFKQSSSFLILTGNLAGCYSSIRSYQNSISTRNVGFELYLKNEFGSYYDKIIDVNVEKQCRDLSILGKYDDIIELLEKLKNYCINKNQSSRTAKYYLWLAQNQSEIGNLSNAKENIDSAEIIISQGDTEPILLGHLSFTKGKYLKRYDPNNNDYLNSFHDAYNKFKVLEKYNIDEFSESAFLLADGYARENHLKSQGVLNDFASIVCSEKYMDNILCIQSRLKEIEILSSYIGQDSLISLITQIEKNEPQLFDNHSLSIILNSLKIRTLETGSIEEKNLIQQSLSRAKFIGIAEEQRWKVKLASHYFQTDSIIMGMQIWDGILKSLEGKTQEIEEPFLTLYAYQLIHFKVDPLMGIEILEKKLDVISEKKYKNYFLLIDGYLLTSRFGEALSLIQEYKNHLRSLQNFSNEYVDVIKKEIEVYKRAGDVKNELRLQFELLELLEQEFPSDYPRQANVTANISQLYIELGNSKKALDLTDQKIEEFKWELSNFSSIDNISSFLGEFILLHTVNLASQFNYHLLNQNYSELNSIEKNYEEFKIICSQLPSDLALFETIIDGQIDILKRFQGKELISQKEKSQFLISEYNRIKNTDNIKAEMLKSQIYTILDYEENDAELFEFATKNGIPLESMLYNRLGLFDIADSIDYSEIKDLILKFHHSKYLLTEDEQVDFKQKITWSLNYDMLHFVQSLHYNDTIDPIYRMGNSNPYYERRTELTASDIYELVLNTKGSVLKSRQKLLQVISEQKELQDIYEKWKTLYETINSAFIKEKNHQSLADTLSKLERTLYQKAELKENGWMKFSEIQNKLKSDEILIQSLRILGTDTMNYLNADSIIYLHFVTTKDTENPIVYAQRMTPEEELDHFENYSYHAYGKGRSNVDKTSFKNLFGFLYGNIQDKKKIIYLPDGIYNKINLGTIFNTVENNYLALTHSIEQLDYPNLIINKENKFESSSNSALLFGFPSFSSYSSTQDSVFEYASMRALPTNCIDSLARGSLNIAPLPETKKEVEIVNKNLSINGWVVSSFTGIEANEINLKNTKSPRVLHIATHGYFLEDIPIESSSSSYFGFNSDQLRKDPMLRSGLLLSGAKKAMEDQDNTPNNGIFSSYEASLLNLNGTELVVLSACETGRGEIKNSEGVYGLRKAFADAGAKNVIMSLWKVDDKVTQEFMALFYEIWLNQKTTIREAFDKTQRDIMAKYPQPYYWGAFILVEN
jgi:CHAT domain-containing protein